MIRKGDRLVMVPITPPYFWIYLLSVIILIMSFIWIGCFSNYYNWCNYCAFCVSLVFAVSLILIVRFVKGIPVYVWLSLGAIFFIIMYVVFIFYKEPEHLEEETIFKPSYVTKELDDFQYNHQCCGWTGPEDYAIPFPPSCCGRRYTNKKFRRCSFPYDRGCKAVYMDNVNTIKTWLVIGDLIRLLIMIALLLILSKYLNELIKQKNRFKCPEYIPDDPLELLYKSSASPICICDDVENETKKIDNESILEKNLDENVTDSDDSEQKETEIFVGRIWSKETIPIKDTTNKSAIHKPKQVKKTKDPILDSRKVIIQDVDSEEEMIKKKDKDKK